MKVLKSVSVPRHEPSPTTSPSAPGRGTSQKLASFSANSFESETRFTKDLYAIKPMAGDLFGFLGPNLDDDVKFWIL